MRLPAAWGRFPAHLCFKFKHTPCTLHARRGITSLSPSTTHQTPPRFSPILSWSVEQKQKYRFTPILPAIYYSTHTHPTALPPEPVLNPDTTTISEDLEPMDASDLTCAVRTASWKKHPVYHFRAGQKTPSPRTFMSDQEVISICNDVTLHVRDLGLLHSQQTRQRMDFIVHERTLLIKILHIKAIVQKDFCIIFDDANGSVVSTAALRLQRYNCAWSQISRDGAPEPTSSSWEETFPGRTVENILGVVVGRLDQRLQQVAPLVRAVLAEIEALVSSEGLKKLIPLKEKVSQMETDTIEVAQVLKQVIDNDDTLRGLNLTGQQFTGGLRGIEAVLEHYRRDVDDLARDITRLLASVDSTREVLSIGLDNQRNKMLLFNLRVSLATLALATIAVPTGVLGMNLTTGLETQPHAFYIVSGLLPILGMAMYKGSHIYLNRAVQSGSRQSAVEIRALRNVLDMLDPIENVFAEAAQNEIHRNEFRKALLEATGRHITDKEMDIICRAYDDDADNHLQNSTYRNILAVSKQEPHKPGAGG